MTSHIRQRPLANTWYARRHGIVALSLSLVILVVGILAYRSATVSGTAQRVPIQIVASAAHGAASPGELDYLRVLSDEQVQRYSAARPDRFQAYRFTRGPVLPDELNYVRVLNHEQVRRYIAARRDTAAQ